MCACECMCVRGVREWACECVRVPACGRECDCLCVYVRM